MGVTYNLILGGGASLPTTLNVTVSGGTATSVTATLGSRSVSLAYDSTSALWSAALPKNATGNWTVTATDGSKTVSDLVAISGPGIWSIELTLGPLPSGYTQLEYIESTGTQYINTGINGTACYGFELVFKPKETTQYESILSGVLDNATFAYFASATATYLRHRGSEIFIDGTVFSDSFNTITLLNNVIKINGTAKANVTTTNAWATSSGNIMLCNNASLSRYAKLYCKSLILYGQDQTTKLRDFTPARRNSDSVLGMYDTVTQTFYTNAGTGTFIAGPDV